MSSFSGKRVLIVEDEALIALMLEDILVEMGATIAGSAATISKGMDLAHSTEFDIAILDVNVRGESILPVAEILRGRGVPTIFATGYGNGIADITKGAPVIGKPYSPEKLMAALSDALDGPRS